MKKKSLVIIIASILVLACAGFGVWYALDLQPAGEYAKADALFLSHDYIAAGEIFVSLGNYRDSAARAAECASLQGDRQYEDAGAEFELAKQTKDEPDVSLTHADAAIAAWTKLGDYKDCKSRINDAQKFKAYLLYSADRIPLAESALTAAGLAGDELLAEKYEIAKLLIDSKLFKQSIGLLESLAGYKDSADLLATIRLQYANELYQNGHIPESAAQLEPISGNVDAEQLKKTVFKSYADILIAAGTNDRAAFYLDYLATDDKSYREPAYSQLIAASKSAGYPERVMGYLTIDKIGLKDLPVAHGTDAATMNKYVAHFTESSLWNDNIAVTAHNRGYAVNYFGNLYDLREGDIVVYRTVLGEHRYAVETYGDIAATEWAVTYPTNDTRMTLITCVKNQPEKRYCVVAKLVE